MRDQVTTAARSGMPMRNSDHNAMPPPAELVAAEYVSEERDQQHQVGEEHEPPG
jgi:hypothetical protein